MSKFDVCYPDAMTPDAKYARALKIGMALTRIAASENDRRTAAGKLNAANFPMKTPQVADFKQNAPQPTNQSNGNDKRSITIRFAGPGEQVVNGGAAFYVGAQAEIAREVGAVHEPDLAKTVTTTIYSKAKAMRFEQTLQSRMAVKDPATLKALNRMAIAGLTNGTITIVGDSHLKPDHAHAVGTKIALALRKLGHDVKMPQLEQQIDRRPAPTFSAVLGR